MAQTLPVWRCFFRNFVRFLPPAAVFLAITGRAGQDDPHNDENPPADIDIGMGKRILLALENMCRVLSILLLVVGFASASPTIHEFNVTADSKLDTMKVSVESLTTSKVARFTISLIGDFHPLEDGSTATMTIRNESETISMVPLSALTKPDGQQFVTFSIGVNFIKESNLTVFLNPSKHDIRAYHIDLESFYNSAKHEG